MVNGTVQFPLVCTAARIDGPDVSRKWIMAIPTQPKPTGLKPATASTPLHPYEINTACVVGVIPEACRYLPVAARRSSCAPVTHIRRNARRE